MAKKITGIIKLQLNAGKATPAPPVGPALGQKQVNIMKVVEIAHHDLLAERFDRLDVALRDGLGEALAPGMANDDEMLHGFAPVQQRRPRDSLRDDDAPEAGQWIACRLSAS